MLHTLRRIAASTAAVALVATTAFSAEVRDRAGMFSPEAVARAEAELSRIEKRTGAATLIETIDAIPDLAADATTRTKLRAINALAEKRARENDARGIYILLSRKDRVLSNVLIRSRLAEALPEPERLEIRDAFIEPFKAGDHDGGLAAATAAIDRALPDGAVAARPAGGRRMVPVAPAPGANRPIRAEQQYGLGTLLLLGAGVLGVLFVIRLLSGSLGARGGHPQGMPRPGPGMGMGGPGMGGPGYGAPGYGRGGGFFSGMLGGLGGALAGNWLYDQFSGRHSPGHYSDASSHAPIGGDFGGFDPGGDEIIGGGDGGGFGGSWGDSGGGDWGGGDDGGSW